MYLLLGNSRWKLCLLSHPPCGLPIDVYLATISQSRYIAYIVIASFTKQQKANQKNPGKTPPHLPLWSIVFWILCISRRISSNVTFAGDLGKQCGLVCVSTALISLDEVEGCVTASSFGVEERNGKGRSQRYGHLIGGQQPLICTGTELEVNQLSHSAEGHIQCGTLYTVSNVVWEGSATVQSLRIQCWTGSTPMLPRKQNSGRQHMLLVIGYLQGRWLLSVATYLLELLGWGHVTT